MCILVDHLFIKWLVESMYYIRHCDPRFVYSSDDDIIEVIILALKFKTKKLTNIEALDKLKSNRKLLYKYNVIMLYYISGIIAIAG